MGEFLEEHGLNSELQYSTDEFTSPIALNANLSIKAIMELQDMLTWLKKLEMRICPLILGEGENMAEQWIKLLMMGLLLFSL